MQLKSEVAVRVAATPPSPEAIGQTEPDSSDLPKIWAAE